MPDVVVFGATGYTGQLVAHALARRGADFAIAGRNATKLKALAAETGHPEIRVANVGDVDSLVKALEGSRVLITLVGPFVELGDTAVEACLRAGTHYVDSTGEGRFIERLITRHHDDARAAGIAMAPAMGFDEVPADVAATLATQGMSDAELVLTYALPKYGSRGTLRTVPGIMTSQGQWIVDGRPVRISAGQEQRWAPMPPPLGPRSSMAFPLAEGFLAPLHLELKTLKLFTTVGAPERIGAKFFLPALRTPVVQRVVRWVADRQPEGPDRDKRSRSYWTILAEARSGRVFRNVALKGTDVYGLTAEVLAAGALKMTEASFEASGVLAPVQAAGLDVLTKELQAFGVEIETYEPTGEGA